MWPFRRKKAERDRRRGPLRARSEERPSAGPAPSRPPQSPTQPPQSPTRPARSSSLPLQQLPPLLPLTLPVSVSVGSPTTSKHERQSSLLDEIICEWMQTREKETSEESTRDSGLDLSGSLFSTLDISVDYDRRFALSPANVTMLPTTARKVGWKSSGTEHQTAISGRRNSEPGPAEQHTRKVTRFNVLQIFSRKKTADEASKTTENSPERPGRPYSLSMAAEGSAFAKTTEGSAHRSGTSRSNGGGRLSAHSSNIYDLPFDGESRPHLDQWWRTVIDGPAHKDDGTEFSGGLLTRSQDACAPTVPEAEHGIQSAQSGKRWCIKVDAAIPDSHTFAHGANDGPETEHGIQSAQSGQRWCIKDDAAISDGHTFSHGGNDGLFVDGPSRGHESKAAGETLACSTSTHGRDDHDSTVRRDQSIANDCGAVGVHSPNSKAGGDVGCPVETLLGVSSKLMAHYTAMHGPGYDSSFTGKHSITADGDTAKNVPAEVARSAGDAYAVPGALMRVGAAYQGNDCLKSPETGASSDARERAVTEGEASKRRRPPPIHVPGEYPGDDSYTFRTTETHEIWRGTDVDAEVETWELPFAIGTEHAEGQPASNSETASLDVSMVVEISTADSPEEDGEPSRALLVGKAAKASAGNRLSQTPSADDISVAPPFIVQPRYGYITDRVGESYSTICSAFN